MGTPAVHQLQASRRKISIVSTSSPEALTVPHPSMAAPLVFPPLHLRATSTDTPQSTLMPQPAMQPRRDSNEEAERRNATALTIVELLARAGPDGSKDHLVTRPPTSLPSLRPPRRSATESAPLPSLPTIRIPSLCSDQRFAFPREPFSSQMPLPRKSPSGRSLMTRSMPLPPAQPVASTTQSPLKRGCAANAAGAVNNSRKRQKDELTRLRAQVQELQRELEHVRSRMPRKKYRSITAIATGTERTGMYSPEIASPLVGLETSGESTDGLLILSVWERMAQHQKEEKSKAEMENLRLKGLLQEQLKLSKGLEKLLQKRCKVSMTCTSEVETSASGLGAKQFYTSDAEETAVFASLASGLEARLAELDTVFQKNGFTRDKQEMQEMQMILDEHRGPVMEMKDAKILPFDVHSCAAAVWQCMEAESKATVMGGSSSDTLCFKSPMPLHHHRPLETELIVRCVIRRVVDRATDRVVFVWESVADRLNRVPHGNAKSIEIRDCGWGLLAPLQSATGEHSSIFQLCSYLMPQLCGVSAEQSRQHIHGLAELVAPCYRRLWHKRQRCVENTLMNGAINAKKEVALK